MRFRERELKDYAEPVLPKRLEIGRVYFSVQFLDDAMLVPILEPFVFLGRNLVSGSQQLLYFQSYESYARGVRFDPSRKADREEFQIARENNLNHIFEYERALDLLMSCSLRRAERAGGPGNS